MTTWVDTEIYAVRRPSQIATGRHGEPMVFGLPGMPGAVGHLLNGSLTQVKDNPFRLRPPFSMLPFNVFAEAAPSYRFLFEPKTGRTFRYYIRDDYSLNIRECALGPGHNPMIPVWMPYHVHAIYHPMHPAPYVLSPTQLRPGQVSYRVWSWNRTRGSWHVVYDPSGEDGNEPPAKHYSVGIGITGDHSIGLFYLANNWDRQILKVYSFSLARLRWAPSFIIDMPNQFEFDRDYVLPITSAIYPNMNRRGVSILLDGTNMESYHGTLELSQHIDPDGNYGLEDVDVAIQQTGMHRYLHAVMSDGRDHLNYGWGVDNDNFGLFGPIRELWRGNDGPNTVGNKYMPTWIPVRHRIDFARPPRLGAPQPASLLTILLRENGVVGPVAPVKRYRATLSKRAMETVRRMHHSMPPSTEMELTIKAANNSVMVTIPCGAKSRIVSVPRKLWDDVFVYGRNVRDALEQNPVLDLFRGAKVKQGPDS